MFSRCSWCQADICDGDEYVSGGQYFCDDECADAYRNEWDEI